jgi:hypothetical protein
MPRCIYCLEEREAAAFTREHVIQKGFGTFADALTLRDVVCAACNQVFGDTIDRELLREGAEGLERYRFGGKDPAEIEQFQYTQVSLRAKIPGDFANARFELKPGSGPDGFVARLATSVGFAKKDGSGFEEYTEEQIVAREWESNPDVDWRLGIRVLGEGEATVRRLTELLNSQGVQPTRLRRFGPSFAKGEEITVQQASSVTEGMQRAIAKIAFNYLAYRMGGDFVLAPAFHATRRFIRYAETPLVPRLETSQDLPFAIRNQPSTGQRPVVHFVCVCSRHPAHGNLLGVVCLFGFMTHTVILAENYDGPWPASHAHLYNPKNRSVHPWKAGVPFAFRAGRARRSK